LTTRGRMLHVTQDEQLQHLGLWALGKQEVGLSAIVVLWYIGTMSEDEPFLVERVQTGVRIEKRLLKVLKALAEFHDLTLGDLLEGIVLHVFDGKSPFSQGSLERIRALKEFYGLELDSNASHRLTEVKRRQAPRKRKS